MQSSCSQSTCGGTCQKSPCFASAGGLKIAVTAGYALSGAGCELRCCVLAIAGLRHKEVRQETGEPGALRAMTMR